MTYMDKILSICIPTLNRSLYLEKLLMSIFSQFDSELGENIEICINDDSLQDDTEYVVNLYRAMKTFDIIYHRNYNNTGLENAIFDVVDMGTGKYRWVISDDDLVIKGGIRIVLEQAKTFLYDYIIVEANTFDDRNGWSNERIYCLKNTEYNNKMQFNNILRDLFIPMTHICISIFSKNFWYSSKIRGDDLSFKYFPHMRRIFSMLPMSEKKTLAIATPIIDARAYNYSYTKNNLVIFYHHLFNILDSLNNFEAASKCYVKTKVHTHFSSLVCIKNLVRSKAFPTLEGSYLVNYDVYRKIRRNLTLKERCIILFVVLVPQHVLRFLWLLLKKIKASVSDPIKFFFRILISLQSNLNKGK